MDGACQSRQREEKLEDQLLQLTMSSQTPRLVLTKDLLDSQLTMETIAIQHPMHSEVAPNSLTPMPVKDNGGKLVSTETTGLIESESSIEETAVVVDFQELKCSLESNSVDLFQEEPETDNGTL